jgi:purine-cytosine permease-like protein
MILLWSTFQASVSLMYSAYLARSSGLSLGQVLWGGVIAVVTLMVYGYGSATLGSYTGQTHTLLTRTIFGRYGSGFVSLLLITMGMGWYGFQAYFLALILQGLFGFSALTTWSIIFGIVMIFNNLFGFRGVAAYARYIAAPILLLWGFYTLIKGVGTVPGHTLFAAPHITQSMTILVFTTLLIGSGMWGNEPDIYRYARRSPWANVPPLFFGYIVGMLVFPVAGYLMAELSSASQFGPIMKYFVNFSLFGFTALATVVFFINQFALNDGNLYEAINALQNVLGTLRDWKRLYSVLILGALGAILAAKMVTLQNNFFIVAGISAVFVPCATVIMVMDVFVVPRFFGLKRPVSDVTPWQFVAPINWVGIVALLIGLIVGSYTGGLIPNIPGFGTTNIGFPPLQAWALSAGCYLIGVAVTRNLPNREVLLGYPRTAYREEAPPAVAAAATT